MTYQTRRVLFFVFVILFFTLTPLIILYASGYRPNFTYRFLEKTGSIIVKNTPKNTQITIKKLDFATVKKTDLEYSAPANIESLRPGKYFISLSAPNYYDWSKQFILGANTAIYMPDTAMLKKVIPELIISGIFTPVDDEDTKTITIQNKQGEQLALDVSQNTNEQTTKLAIFTLQNQEIVKTDISNLSRQVIVRSAEKPINNFAVIEEIPYVFYSTNDAIMAIEITNETQNAYTVANTKINDLFYNSNEKILYYTNEIGIYKIEF